MIIIIIITIIIIIIIFNSYVIILFKKRTGVYYQVLRREAKVRVFTPDNTRLRFFLTASKSVI